MKFEIQYFNEIMASQNIWLSNSSKRGTKGGASLERGPLPMIKEASIEFNANVVKRQERSL